MAYVYRHIRHDKNQPFYIGIGEDKYRHNSKWSRNPIWLKIVAKTKWESEIMLTGLTWGEACEKEKEFIKLYGRINKKTGVLSNMTDGGDGNLGLVHSEEALKKISEASRNRGGYWKGKKMSEEFCKQMSEARKGVPRYDLRGRPISESQRESVRKHSYGNKYHLGKKHTEESKRKMSESMKGREGRGKKLVSQYTLEGEYVMTFESISAAKKHTRAKEIYKVCEGIRKSSGGYLWRFGNNKDKIEPPKYLTKRDYNK